MSIACSCTAAPALRDRRAIGRCSPHEQVLRPAFAAPHAWARAARPVHGRQPWHISASGDPGPSTEQKPADKEDLPPWARNEQARKLAAEDGSSGIPFGVYLLGSALVAIAAVGSMFDIANRNPIFGVLPPENPLWLPILGLFAVTGLPSAGYLFYKSVDEANKLSERMDKMDGNR